MTLRQCMAALAALPFLSAGLLRAQAVAPPINPAPLEHPSPLVTVSTADMAGLLAKIRGALRAADFEISRLDAARFVVEARHPGIPAKGFDRILVWLEWNPHEPGRTVELYLVYGRYEEIWTQEGRETHRVVVNQAVEDQRAGPIKQALIDLASQM